MSSTNPPPPNPPTFHLKPPYRNKTEQFQQLTGQCFLALQQYKLKTNLLGCNMNRDEFKKYYNYYEQKPRKRLELTRGRLEGLVRTYERNSVFFQALELRAVNNMARNYRRKMNLMTNQPTSYNYAKFQKDQNQLMQTIISNDYSKLDQLSKLLTKIKSTDQSASHSIPQLPPQPPNPSPSPNQPTHPPKAPHPSPKPNFSKLLKAINKSQLHYYRYFESFERSIANMINQIHSHLDKLAKFYTMWENLGSAAIYQMKSDREVYIDKLLEEKKGRGYAMEEDEDQIMQVIDVMPVGSKIRQVYQDKLQGLKNKNSRCYGVNTNTSYNQANIQTKFRKSNLKQSPQNITKVSWYETESQDVKQIYYNDSMVLKEKQDGFFRYTYEQLHMETLSYLDSIKSKRIVNDFFGGEESYHDRFYVFCEKKERNREENNLGEKVEKYNVPRQMSFDCWFDRYGPKGAFNILDFPTNVVQRKLQFQNDRQTEMQTQDQKRRKQYNNKQAQLEQMDDKGCYSIGYRELNPNKELQQLRAYLTNVYDLDFLPMPMDLDIIGKEKERKEVFERENRFVEDFSDSDEGEQGKQKEKDKDIEAGNEENIMRKSKKGQDTDRILFDSQNNEGNLQILQQEQSQQQPSIQQAPAPNPHPLQSQSFKSAITAPHPTHSPTQPPTQPSTHPLTHQIRQNPWLQTKQKQKDTLQQFAQCYLPEMDRMINMRMKAEYLSLGHTEEEVQKVCYRFLGNFQVESIRRVVMETNYCGDVGGAPRVGPGNNSKYGKTPPGDIFKPRKHPKKHPHKHYQKQNLNKLYLLSKQFYIKIQPIFFHALHKRTIKIYIFMTSPLKQFQKLKQNLESVLSYYGKCTYQLNVDLHQRNESNEEKFHAMIGHLLRNQKMDRNLRNLLDSVESVVDYGEIGREGERVYEAFQRYYKGLRGIEAEDGEL